VLKWKNRTEFCLTIEKGRLRSPFFVGGYFCGAFGQCPVDNLQARLI